MKIVVTGGAGFIGSNLVDALVEQGHQILVIDDLSTGKKEYINYRAKFKQLDIRDESLAMVISDFSPEVIYHLAAQKNVRTSLTDPRLDASINVLGALNLLKAALNAKVEKFIFVSTGGIYGDSKVLPTPESAPEQAMSPYILNKLTFEKYLSILSEDRLSWTALRLANIYGPRQDPQGEAGVIAIFLDQALKGEVLNVNGDGKQTRDYLYVDDAVQALVKALTVDDGVYNIGTGIETSLIDLIANIKKISGRDLKVKHREAVWGEVRRSSLDANLAKIKLGWQPHYDLATGLSLTYKWFRDRK